MAHHDSRIAQRSNAARRRISRISVSAQDEPVPALPHERDESADSQRGEPKKVIQRAAADLRRGQQDTDRGAQMNRVYRKLKKNP